MRAAGSSRQTELREGSATGKLRATWTYDTVTKAKGQLAQSTRYIDGSAYTAQVTQYDRLYRPVRTAVVVPERENSLKGTYQAGTSYLPSGLVGGVSFSAAGSLPGGSQSFTYEPETLRPVSLLGDGFKAETSYSLTGKPLQYTMYGTAAGAKPVQVTNTYEWGTQRLANTRVDRQDVAGVDQSSTYRYDEAGNVLSVSDVSRSGTDNQCFTYDYLARLTEAWTQNTTSCATTPSGSAPGGPAPYWHSYTYDLVGNRTTETLHDTGGNASQDTKRTYAYPAPGSTRPHALSSVTTTGPTGTAKDTFGYDDTGNTTTRTLSGTAQSLEWDAEGHLAKLTEPVEGDADKLTEYLYDADGNRLIGRTPTETTLYLGATEITLAKGSTTPKATRYYDIGGGNQAVKADDGSVSFTLADHHGTAQLAIEAGTQKLTQRRTMPFGGIRGTEPDTWPGTKGFVGGTDDTRATGLTHLGAREYDPALGRFLSVDPVLDPLDPQQLNAYAYANGNPVTLSDPSGLMYFEGDNTGGIQAEPSKAPAVVKSAGKKGNRTDHNVSYYKSAPIVVAVGTGTATFANNEALSKARLALEKREKGLYKAWTELPTCMMGQPGCAKIPWHTTVQAVVFKTICDIDGVSCDGIQSFRDALGESAAYMAEYEARINATLAGGQVAKAAERRASGMSVGGCKCFLAGTGVLMADGATKNIEDVKIGDQVLATDPKTGETAPKKVTRLIVTDGDKHFNELSIATEDGIRHLTATHEHPFWSPSERDWVKAGALTPGMSLLTDDGSTVTVTANRAFTTRARTYNLTVDDLHTYYVLAGQTPVLVHNSNCVGAGRDLIGGQEQFHIIHGDRTGGGHKWPGQPGKTVFPRGWDTDKILDSIADVATSPNSVRTQQTGRPGALYTKNGDPSRWKVEGVVDGVNIRVIYEPATDRIVTGFPYRP